MGGGGIIIDILCILVKKYSISMVLCIMHNQLLQVCLPRGAAPQ